MYKENPIKKKVGVKIYKEKPIEKKRPKMEKKSDILLYFFFKHALFFEITSYFFGRGAKY